ncbi:hypothetical protein Sp245p_25995 (plasmid) [Azospirillum baldaniorum]|uniref:Uncharacterized protein n=1 Tax=Azospirillum baldaniorum TaxID=1064539 RepID=A0A9P1NRC8_9PROT|nr:YdaS family helix-turn-helix protein [Azospirillum baldaniorum]AWJ93279.1 hypothetical protein Sp245p_25995 [Azospirillum baldaniorum]TWA77973.1 YdaS antitoxin of YdaST toxin-antitoxin system [Azospirillum brasilense]CCD02927.1 conserved protein of unknown function [Azospirillum baldaniorum]
MKHEATPLEHAVGLAGGQAALARKLREARGLNVQQGHVWYWLNKSGKLPPQYAADVEAVTGVSKNDLRPDVFGRDA